MSSELELQQVAAKEGRLCVAVYFDGQFSPRHSILRSPMIECRNLVATLKLWSRGRFASCTVESSTGQTVELEDRLLEKGWYRCHIQTVGNLPVAAPIVLTKSVCDCLRPPDDAGFCLSANLVDMSRTIEQALEHITRYCPVWGGNTWSVPPLFYTGHSKCGKTTVLHQLFDELKAAGYAPIFVSFNLATKRTDECGILSLLRPIAMHMSDTANPHAKVDELKLASHIAETCEGKGVVLLIDDLDQLGPLPLDRFAAEELGRNWLDARNRYVVCTSTVPMDLVCPITTSDSRGTVSAKHPQCMDLAILSNMFPETADTAPVTAAQAALYSGIPSLIYAARTQELPAPQIAFPPQTIEEERKALRELLDCIVTGKQSPCGSDLFQYGFAPTRYSIQWPLMHILLLLSHFEDARALGFDTLTARALNVLAEGAGTDLIWKLVVRVAFLIQSLRAEQDSTLIYEERGPFDIVSPRECVSRIELLEFDSTVVSTAQAWKKAVR